MAPKCPQNKNGLPRATQIEAVVLVQGGRDEMKYLIAWGLGVPGVLVVIWFVMSHH
jgi:hypothetical protein